MTWRLGIPGKSSLRLVPRYMEFARGPTFLELYGELPPRLGCNPKRSNRHSSIHLSILPFIHIAQLGAVVLTVLVGQLSCATPQVLQFGDILGGS